MVLLAFGCGTDAVGTTECREIEQARCAAAAACGFPDVAECERYYRAHCLHGVPLDAVSSVEVDTCVRDIERAGRCAAGQGPSTAPSACAEPVPLVGTAAEICDVVRGPEVTASCAFLGSVESPPPVVVPSPDAGGS
jgi:hypothetical protein